MTETIPATPSPDTRPASLHIGLKELVPPKLRKPLACLLGGLAFWVSAPQIPAVYGLLPEQVAKLYDSTGGQAVNSLEDTVRVVLSGDPFAPGKERGVFPGLPVGPADIPILPFPAQSEVPLG